MNKPTLSITNFDPENETITLRITNFGFEHIPELQAFVGPVVSDKPFVPGTAPVGFGTVLLSANATESHYGPSGFNIISTTDNS